MPGLWTCKLGARLVLPGTAVLLWAQLCPALPEAWVGVGQSPDARGNRLLRGENPGRLGKTSGDRILPASSHLHPLGKEDLGESSANWRRHRLRNSSGPRRAGGGVGGIGEKGSLSDAL